MSQVDFYSMLSGLGDTIAAKRKEAARRQAFADINNPDGTVDFQKAIMGLANAGDIQGATLMAQFRNRQEDQARQARLDARQLERDKAADARAAQSAGLAERQFAFQKDQAREKPTIQKIKDEAGNEILVRVLPDGSYTELRTSTGGTGGNPFGPGKFNEGEGKAAGFADRMLQSEGILRGTGGAAGVEAQGADLGQTARSKVPTVGNYLVSQDRQKFEQAKRDFINAQLRRESGAAISASEFESADKQYFPVPGDSPETIKQKAANRRAAVEAIGREGGRSYRPKMIYTTDGRVVALPKVGELKDGYRFKGGDPSDPNSWAKAQ